LTSPTLKAFQYFTRGVFDEGSMSEDHEEFTRGSQKSTEDESEQPETGPPNSHLDDGSEINIDCADTLMECIDLSQSSSPTSCPDHLHQEIFTSMAEKQASVLKPFIQPLENLASPFEPDVQDDLRTRKLPIQNTILKETRRGRY
jgi:hypothetical protein